MKKRLCAFMMCLCMAVISMVSSFGSIHAKSADNQTKYVAFGDSIAAGYGMPGYSASQQTAPAGSYQALLGDFLKTQPCNYAVTGDNSDDCIQILNSGTADADLQEADVISLSIGSNDLLLPFIQIVMDYFGIESGSIDQSQFTDGFTMPELDPSEIMNYYKQSAGLIAELTNNAVLHEKAAAFSGQLQTILSLLHEKAPNAEIYVTNIYNPFISVPMFGELGNTYIKEINQAFSKDAAEYTLVDVNSLIANDPSLTNVTIDMANLSKTNIDPHPSAKGHKAIANLLIQALKTAHAPKAASLKSAASGSKYKLTAKIKLPAGADGCQILYAASKNGTYKTLAATDKTAYKTNSKKLKAGKTYYIKVRSYKTQKGVTYYGKDSGAKKIKIAKKS